MTNKQITWSFIAIVIIFIIILLGTRQIVVPVVQNNQPVVTTTNTTTDTSVPAKGKLPADSPAPGELKAIIGTWVWQRTVVRDAPVITPKIAGKFTATFDAKGNVGGTTDCNGYGGSYKQGSDGIISIGSMMSTMMYCEGSQEQVFTGQLSKANGYSFDDKGNLLINFDNDAGSMVFAKK